ncbi:hypothetical protein PybrP1_009087 [[Pythium] brassicae (nom. inval.)]|nr:hypothetical protein PybrP1_009087 [[Pythium] brassicae (nom. inval.)]
MRKDQKLIVGFVATLAGVAGALHVYLPFYSKLGQEARERAGRGKADDGGDAAKRSSSMWKNMDKRARE